MRQAAPCVPCCTQERFQPQLFMKQQPTNTVVAICHNLFLECGAEKVSSKNKVFLHEEQVYLKQSQERRGNADWQGSIVHYFLASSTTFATYYLRSLTKA